MCAALPGTALGALCPGVSTTYTTETSHDWDAFYSPLLGVYQDSGAGAGARADALAQIVAGATTLVHKMVQDKLPGGQHHPSYADACQELLLGVVEMAGAYRPSRGVPFEKWLSARTSRLRFTLLSFTRGEGDKKDLNMLSRRNTARDALSAAGVNNPGIGEICEEILRESRESRTTDLTEAHPELGATEIAVIVERWLSKQSIKAGVGRLRNGSLNTPEHVSLQKYCTGEDGAQVGRSDANLVCAPADAYIDADDGDVSDLLALATLGLPAREASTTRAVLAAAGEGQVCTSISEVTTRAVLADVATRVASPHAQYAAYGPGLAGQFRTARLSRAGTLDERVLAQLEQLATT